MRGEAIHPDWKAPEGVHGLVTTRVLGDMKSEAGRRSLRAQLPADPVWLRQVHGVHVVDAERAPAGIDADASFTTGRNVVCAVMAADCMPVLFADDAGGVVAAAHAGWRGLCAGVLEATHAADYGESAVAALSGQAFARAAASVRASSARTGIRRPSPRSPGCPG